jgi:hypothetical protein
MNTKTMPYSFEMRLGSENEYTNMLMDAISNEIHCAAPAIVNKFYPEDMTVDVQLTVKDKILINGEYVSLKIKQLGKLPVVLIGGGNFVITCPIKVGDECLVIFSDSCIDAWWQNGGEENEPIIMRKHHLSDGFAIVGPRSIPNAIADYNEDAMEIRNLTGTTKIQVSDKAVTVISESVQLGDDTGLRKLIDERFVDLFNQHTHPYTNVSSLAQTGTPTVPITLTETATEKTEAI